MKRKKPIYLLLLMIFGLLTFENSNAQMFWNQAGKFVGNANSYISRENSPSLNLTGSFTIEAWINPEVAGATQTLIQKREGNNISGYSMYLFNGRVAVRTNANTRIISKSVLPVDKWTYVSVSYNSGTNAFYIFINAVTDTSTTIPGAAPISGSDSIFIGKGSENPFQGQLDEIKIWNNSQGSGNIASNMLTSLGASSGVYSNLVLSLTFQKRNPDGAFFSLDDQTENSNNFYNRGVIASDLSNRPSNTIFTNLSAKFDGDNDYLAAPDAGQFSPIVVFTLEAYIYPTALGIGEVIIHKGFENGFITNYGLRLNQGNVVAYINNQVNLISQNSVPLNRWTHLAFVYNANTGSNLLYMNGELTDSQSSNTGNVINGIDSFYVGGTLGLPDFTGYIDEVRIKLAIKTYNEINQFLFKSIDESNDLSGSEYVFNLDGNTFSSVGTTMKLNFRNNARFGNAGKGTAPSASPLHRADEINFNEGYVLKKSDRRIPATGTSGNMNTDSLYIYQSEIINDINLFVAIDHENEHDLTLTLVSPGGVNFQLFNNNYYLDENTGLVTIFDDQADSMISNNKYQSFEPSIKPVLNMNSAFSGLSSSGYWKLLVNDNSSGDTGRLVSWGIQFNNKTNKLFALNSTSIIQGFYNPVTNNSVRDTMQINLRKATSPYNIIDSAKSYYLPSGFSTYIFNNAVAGTPYYLELDHRNSIETWSSSTIEFEALSYQSYFNFSINSAQSYGNNLMQIDNSPLRFAVYNGDVNKDGIIDVTDNSQIDNAAYNFITGYVITDLTGDNAVDISDAAISDNNASAFISKITP